MFSPFESEENEVIRKHYLHLMKSPNAYEKQTFILRIKELEAYLEENWQLYNLTKESDFVMRSMILREIESLFLHRLWKTHRVTISK